MGFKSWAVIGGLLMDCIYSAALVSMDPEFALDNHRESNCHQQSARLLEAFTETCSALACFNKDKTRATDYSTTLEALLREDLNRLSAAAQQIEMTSSHHMEDDADNRSKNTFGDGLIDEVQRIPDWSLFFEDPEGIREGYDNKYSDDHGNIQTHGRQLYLLESYLPVHGVPGHIRSALWAMSSLTESLMGTENEMRELLKVSHEAAGDSPLDTRQLEANATQFSEGAAFFRRCEQAKRAAPEFGDYYAGLVERGNKTFADFELAAAHLGGQSSSTLLETIDSCLQTLQGLSVREP